MADDKTLNAEEAYKIVLETERATLVRTRDELQALKDALGSPLAEIVRNLPQFAGPRSAPITKIRGFSMTLGNWPTILSNMIREINVEISKYDAYSV